MPRYLVKIDDTEYDIELTYRSEKYYAIINGREMEVNCTKLGESRSIMLIDDKSLEVDIRSNGYDQSKTAFILGQEIPVEIENYNLAQLKKTAGMSGESTMSKQLKAPMPGLVLVIKAAVGDSVKKGDPLIIIEAMKMENIIKASGDGVIKNIAVEDGQSVEKDIVLMEFE